MFNYKGDESDLQPLSRSKAFEGCARLWHVGSAFVSGNGRRRDVLPVIDEPFAVDADHVEAHDALRVVADRIESGQWVFVVAIAMAIILAMLSISYHAVRAATSDPVKAVRYE